MSRKTISMAAVGFLAVVPRQESTSLVIGADHALRLDRNATETDVP